MSAEVKWEIELVSIISLYFSPQYLVFIDYIEINLFEFLRLVKFVLSSTVFQCVIKTKSCHNKSCYRHWDCYSSMLLLKRLRIAWHSNSFDWILFFLITIIAITFKAVCFINGTSWQNWKIFEKLEHLALLIERRYENLMASNV